jgi:hypothetical protein
VRRWTSSFHKPNTQIVIVVSVQIWAAHHTLANKMSDFSRLTICADHRLYIFKISNNLLVTLWRCFWSDNAVIAQREAARCREWIPTPLERCSKPPISSICCLASSLKLWPSRFGLWRKANTRHLRACLRDHRALAFIRGVGGGRRALPRTDGRTNRQRPRDPSWAAMIRQRIRKGFVDRDRVWIWWFRCQKAVFDHHNPRHHASD